MYITSQLSEDVRKEEAEYKAKARPGTWGSELNLACPDRGRAWASSKGPGRPQCELGGVWAEAEAGQLLSQRESSGC